MKTLLICLFSVLFSDLVNASNVSSIDETRITFAISGDWYKATFKLPTHYNRPTSGDENQVAIDQFIQRYKEQSFSGKLHLRCDCSTVFDRDIVFMQSILSNPALQGLQALKFSNSLHPSIIAQLLPSMPQSLRILDLSETFWLGSVGINHIDIFLKEGGLPHLLTLDLRETEPCKNLSGGLRNAVVNGDPLINLINTLSVRQRFDQLILTDEELFPDMRNSINQATLGFTIRFGKLDESLGDE